MVADDPERALHLRPSTAGASDQVQRGGQASIVEGGHFFVTFSSRRLNIVLGSVASIKIPGDERGNLCTCQNSCHLINASSVCEGF